MSATYRFVGDAPEVFLRFAGVMSVAGVERDPGAEGYVAPWVNGEPNPDYQQPGELRPGQAFELPEELYVRHARVERQVGDGEWAPTITPESPPADDEVEADAEQADGEQADGEQADGEQADGNQADGEQADGVPDGEQAGGETIGTMARRRASRREP